MMKNKKRLAACVMALTVILAGCGGSAGYADGTYTGTSSVYENEDGSTDGNGYGVVTVTVSGGVITDCVYETYEIDGTKKDTEYGKEGGSIKNKDYYNKAQKAVMACQEYADMLVANGSTKGLDAISGATINYNEFLEAVDDALSQAKE